MFSGKDNNGDGGDHRNGHDDDQTKFGMMKNGDDDDHRNVMMVIKKVFGMVKNGDLITL